MDSKYLKYILHAAVLIGLGIAAYKYLNGEEVLEAIQNFDYIYLPAMLGITTGYLALKSWRFVYLVRPVSDIPWLISFKAFAAGQAATLVPGGIAARAGLMRQVGVPVARSSAPVAISSALDQVVFILGSLIAALWFPYARMPALILLGVLVFLGLIFLIPTSRGWLVRAADWIARKFNIVEDWRNFLDSVPKIIITRIMLITMSITLIAFLFKIIVLHLSLLGVGLSLSYPTLFLAYILPTMLGRIFPLPAGVGVTEAGMVGFMSSTAGTDLNTTAAAVAMFRIATVAFEALLGALVYFFAWRGEEELTSSAVS